MMNFTVLEAASQIQLILDNIPEDANLRTAFETMVALMVADYSSEIAGRHIDVEHVEDTIKAIYKERSQGQNMLNAAMDYMKAHIEEFPEGIQDLPMPPSDETTIPSDETTPGKKSKSNKKEKNNDNN